MFIFVNNNKKINLFLQIDNQNFAIGYLIHQVSDCFA